MINQTLLKNYVSDNADEINFLSAVIQNLMSSSENIIIITDSKYRVLLSNRKLFFRGENVLQKFKLKENHFLNEISDIKRIISSDDEKTMFGINIKRINAQNNGFLLVLKDISKEFEYKQKFNDLICFLKHELKTPLISQIMALKLVLKSEEHKSLLPEILNSEECSYRILNNYLKDVQNEESELIIHRKEVNINSFLEGFEENCQNFLKSKNIKFRCLNAKNIKIYIDENLLLEAFENILYNLCENSRENSIIELNTVFLSGRINFIFTCLHINFGKENFEKIHFEEYRKLGCNSGLNMAKKIISAHSGTLKIVKQNNEYTTVKINLPK